MFPFWVYCGIFEFIYTKSKKNIIITNHLYKKKTTNKNVHNIICCWFCIPAYMEKLNWNSFLFGKLKKAAATNFKENYWNLFCWIFFFVLFLQQQHLLFCLSRKSVCVFGVFRECVCMRANASAQQIGIRWCHIFKFCYFSCALLLFNIWKERKLYLNTQKYYGGFFKTLICLSFFTKSLVCLFVHKLCSLVFVVSRLIFNLLKTLN